MSLIETNENYRYAWYLRPILALMRRRLGKLPESVRLWARLPWAFLGFQLMHRALERKHSPLDGRLRALIRTHIARLNHCDFCIDLNASHALARGATEGQLNALGSFHDSPLFSDAEKAALAYAEAITGTGIEIDPVSMEPLRQVYGDDGVVELAALVAQQNMSAKFNAALGVRAEGYCRLPRAG